MSEKSKNILCQLNSIVTLHILCEFLNKTVIIYLNNILIYSNFIKKHYKHVKNVLKKLVKYYLYMKSLKYIIERFTLELYKHLAEKRNI